MVKVTFTLDEASIERLETAAARLARPKSQVVREAILDYADRVGRLTERERRDQLDVLDRFARTTPARTEAEVDRELTEDQDEPARRRAEVTHLDTSALVAALTGPRRALPRLRQLIADGERLAISTLVRYEWLRGPRTPEELSVQEALFPAAAAVSFGVAEAERAAALYRSVSHPRGRDVDLAIAACAITHGATLWTLNDDDFADIPGLSLIGAWRQHEPTPEREDDSSEPSHS